MIWKTTVLTSILMSIAFVSLWFQRRASAEQRRFTCACALVACAIVWSLALVPPTWLPAVQPKVGLSFSAAGEQYSQSIAKEAFTSTPMSEVRSFVARAPSVSGVSEFDWSAIYRLGVALALLVWIGGWVYSIRLAYSGRTLEELQRKSKWRTCLVPRLMTPLCLGWPCRCILLPTEAVDWDASTLDTVIRHEESHICSQDHAWIHLAHLLCIFQWFNPLTWCLARRLRVECEHVADNSVLSFGITPSRYAEVLLRFQSTRTMFLPLAAVQQMVRKSGFTQRLESILSPATRRVPMNRKTALSIATGVVIGCSVIAALTFGQAKKHPIATYSLLGANDATVPHQEYVEQREAMVSQIGMKVQGKPVVWDAYRHLIPADQIIEHKWQSNREFALTLEQVKRSVNSSARYAHIVFRVKALPTDEQPEAFAEIQPDPSENGPGVGTDLPTEYLLTTHGWHYFVSPHAIFSNPLRQNGVAPFGHGLATGDWTICVAKKVDEGSIDKLPLFSKWTAKQTSKPRDLTSVDSAKLLHSTVWCKVGFSRPTRVWQEIHFFRKDGSAIPDSLVSGEYIEGPARNHILQAYYILGVPSAEIGDVRVTTRKSIHVNFSGIPMAPKIGPDIGR